MNLGCVVANDGPTLSFFSQLMAYPVFSVCMLLVWWCMTKCQRGIFKGSELLNINGLVLMTLYVTLTIVSLLRWQCVRNPNGTLTMQTQPGVVCFLAPILGLSMTQHPKIACCFTTNSLCTFFAVVIGGSPGKEACKNQLHAKIQKNPALLYKTVPGI